MNIDDLLALSDKSVYTSYYCLQSCVFYLLFLEDFGVKCLTQQRGKFEL
jgi:hypothetical protein